MARQTVVLGILRGYTAIGRRARPKKYALNADGDLIDVTPGPGRSYTRATYPPHGRGRGESLTSQRRMAAKLRAFEAMKLYCAGHTWKAIARSLGFADASGAWRAVRRLMDYIDI